MPPPSSIQCGALALAVLLEVSAFAIVMPRLRSRGERPVIAATLAIVGAHFLIMTPAFGPLIAALGILCLANAGLVMVAKTYAVSKAWLIDGLLKLACGGALLCTSPLVNDTIARAAS